MAADARANGAPGAPHLGGGAAASRRPFAAGDGTGASDASGASSAPESSASSAPESSGASDAGGADGAAGSSAPAPDGAGRLAERDGRSGGEEETPRPAGSRRFPRITRDTARPEGGGRAASGDAPAPARQWPLLAVLGGTATGLLVVAADAVRIGTLIIGLALIAGAVLRRVLPSVGMLAVRSRFTDMVTYGALGVVIVLLAMMIQPDPWLEMPWLQDLIRAVVR
ncbi:DUF3017 domain-containing protein [Streptomyces sp. NPDC048639]|uniref:DUF3017 domain-containing protein n=1 Tax=Streptomyces sp. NPDC048639 TaxID=3365581 RepID=UPI003715B719